MIEMYIGGHLKKLWLSFSVLLVLLIGLDVSLTLVGQKQDVEKHAAVTGKSNTVVFMVDDLDENTFNQLLLNNKLPNIKKYIIDKGVRFANSFVVDSICCSSRATFLTGKFPQNHGVFNVVGAEGGTAGFGNNLNNNLAVWLRDSQIQTAQVGKSMNGVGYSFPGFDYFRNITSYDSRPGMYSVLYAPNQSIRPDVYQAKYMSDTANNFLNNTVTGNFFLWVTPHSPHINLPSWKIVSDGGFSDVISSSNIPIVGYSLLISAKDPAVWKTVIKGPDLNKNYHVFDRKKTSLGVWSDWIEVVGSGSSLFPGTADLPIVSFNRMNHPDVPDGYREQLVRGNVAGQEIHYSRDVRNGVAGAWQTLGTTAVMMPNTGNLPVVGFSSSDLPNGNIHQMLLRGDVNTGYELYSRARYGGSWLPWVKEAESWDTDSGWGPLVDLDAKHLGSGILDFRIVRLEKTTNRYVEYSQNLRSLYYPVPTSANQVLGTSTDTSVETSFFTDEGNLFGSSANTAPAVVAGTPEYPHIFWSGRVFADGNWVKLDPSQSFPVSLYSDGRLPAGSLRLNGDPNGFTPINVNFDLPHLSSANFNSSQTCDSSNKLAFICANWPDLNQPVRGGKTQLDYVRRLHLDRLESMLSVDVMVGEVMKNLEQKQLLNNTLVIFTSDNGMFMGEYRMGNKMWPYDDSIRVPLIIRPPNSVLTVGQTNQNTVINPDLAATILDYSGMDWKSSSYKVDGRSLRPLLETLQSQVANWRKYFPVQYHYPRDPANKQLPYAYYVNNPYWAWGWALPDIAALRFGTESQPSEFKNFLYSENTDDPLKTGEQPFYELYNLTADPGEIKNIYGTTSADTKSYMHNLLAALISCSGSACRDLDAGWQLDMDGVFSSEVESTTIPLVGYSQFDPKISEVVSRANVIKGPDVKGIYYFYENTKNTNGNWSGWHAINLPSVNGNQFPGTQNLPVIYYNAFQSPDMANGYREQLGRGNVAGQEVHYYRDVINGVVGNWILSGSTAQVFPNTGTLPVLGFSASDYTDKNIYQYLLRGMGTTKELYARSRMNGVWTAWTKQPTGWDKDTGVGLVTSMNGRFNPNGNMDLRIVKKDTVKNKYVLYKRAIKP